MAVTIYRRTPTAFDHGQWRINFGHPLARELRAAFVFNNASASQISSSGRSNVGKELVRGVENLQHFYVNDVTAQMFSPHGPGVHSPITTGGARGASGPVGPALRIQGALSLFWYGTIMGNRGAASNAFLLGVSHTDSLSDPFYSYCLFRDGSNQTHMGGAWATGGAGTIQSCGATGLIASSDYGVNPMSFGLTIAPGAVRLYKNGREVATGTGTSTIGYGTNPLLGIGCTPSDSFTPDCNVSTGVALIYGAALTPTEHVQLAQNPYQIFGRPGKRGSILTDGGAVTGMIAERYGRGIGRGILRGAR